MKYKKRRHGELTIFIPVSGFTGTKAFEHYLLCIQLVLRKQLRWLIDIQKLPEELETVVRDLFALRLQKLQHKVRHIHTAQVNVIRVIAVLPLSMLHLRFPCPREKYKSDGSAEATGLTEHA